MRARAVDAAVLSVVVVLAAACGSTAPICRLPAPPGAPAPAPFLWRVQASHGASVWLFGTIHDAGADDVPPAAWRSLDGAARLVSELGDQEPDRARVTELARLPWGQVLDRMLGADDWWELVIALDGAMSEDELRRARPWFAMVRLHAHVARPPQPSMDVALATRARGAGIAVEALESWEQQLVALDASVTAAELSHAIRTRGTAACAVATLVSAYRARDLPRLTPLLIVPVRTALLVERNRRWLPQIERHLAAADPGAAAPPGATFVAVGLGHLIGDDGLPAMLARAGYTVERAGTP